MLKSFARIAVVGVVVAALGVAWSAAGLAAAPSSAEANEQGARAAAVDVPGAVTVGESAVHPRPEEQSWTAAEVAGLVVLGKMPSGWTGLLSPAGAIVDAVNAATCPGAVVLAGHSAAVCVSVLGGAVDFNHAPYKNRSAAGSLASVAAYGTDLNTGQATGAAVVLAPSSADGYRRGVNCFDSSNGEADVLRGAYALNAIEPTAFALTPTESHNAAQCLGES